MEILSMIDGLDLKPVDCLRQIENLQVLLQFTDLTTGQRRFLSERLRFLEFTACSSEGNAVLTEFAQSASR
jgi:hypothetical protein